MITRFGQSVTPQNSKTPARTWLDYPDQEQEEENIPDSLLQPSANIEQLSQSVRAVSNGSVSKVKLGPTLRKYDEDSHNNFKSALEQRSQAKLFGGAKQRPAAQGLHSSVQIPVKGAKTGQKAHAQMLYKSTPKMPSFKFRGQVIKVSQISVQPLKKPDPTTKTLKAENTQAHEKKPTMYALKSPCKALIAKKRNALLKQERTKTNTETVTEYDNYSVGVLTEQLPTKPFPSLSGVSVQQKRHEKVSKP